MDVKKAKSGPQIDIGISEAERAKIARGLAALLADSYTLYLMTHNFHWNVTGPMFNTLHLMFMQQYTEQWNALDLIAERIRALGHPAPGTYKEFGKLASIKEVDGQPKVYAIADEDLERENDEKTSSVHFLRFEFEPPAIEAIRKGAAVAIGIDHPNYSVRLDEVAPEVQSALARDFG